MSSVMYDYTFKCLTKDKLRATYTVQTQYYDILQSRYQLLNEKLFVKQEIKDNKITNSENLNGKSLLRKQSRNTVVFNNPHSVRLLCIESKCFNVSYTQVLRYSLPLDTKKKKWVWGSLLSMV